VTAFRGEILDETLDVLGIFSFAGRHEPGETCGWPMKSALMRDEDRPDGRAL
jgi:hypothetical protein